MEGFAIIKSDIIPFKVDFENKYSYLMLNPDGTSVVCPKSDFAEDKTELEKKMKARAMVALCREVSKETGEVSTYELDTEVTNNLLFELHIRGVYNPELRYFVTFRDYVDEDFLDKMVTDVADMLDEGVLVEL